MHSRRSPDDANSKMSSSTYLRHPRNRKIPLPEPYAIFTLSLGSLLKFGKYAWIGRTGDIDRKMGWALIVRNSESWSTPLPEFIRSLQGCTDYLRLLKHCRKHRTRILSHPFFRCKPCLEGLHINFRYRFRLPDYRACCVPPTTHRNFDMYKPLSDLLLIELPANPVSPVPDNPNSIRQITLS